MFQTTNQWYMFRPPTGCCWIYCCSAMVISGRAWLARLGGAGGVDRVGRVGRVDRVEWLAGRENEHEWTIYVYMDWWWLVIGQSDSQSGIHNLLNNKWAIQNTPIPSDYTTWLIGFPTMGPIIIPSKPGSIIPYSNQLTRLFLMAQMRQMKPSQLRDLGFRASATNGIPFASWHLHSERGHYYKAIGYIWLYGSIWTAGLGTLPPPKKKK